MGPAYSGTWLYSCLVLRPRPLGGPLQAWAKRVASPDTANIEFLNANKTVTQLSTEGKEQGARSKEQGAEYVGLGGWDLGGRVKSRAAGMEVGLRRTRNSVPAPKPFGAEIWVELPTAEKVFMHRRT